MKASAILILLLFLLDYSLSLHLDCPHDHIGLDLDDDDDDEDPYDGRMLQSEYSNIRIYVDYSLLDTDVETEVQDYIKNQLVPPVVNYYQQTLRVIPRTKKLTYKKDTICGLATPQIFLNEGVDADIAFIIDASYEDTSYIAYARACSVQGGDKRPNFGNAHFNLKYVVVGNEKTHEQNLLVALHEMAHVFGISKGLFDYYYNPDTGTTRQGHVITRNLNGVTSYFVDVEPLTSKLREFYNCPTLEGALLENEGESMSASHFERRVFYSEIMTAGEMEEARLSEFMLAFLEGTGWYKGNYEMTEPVHWGRGKGCDFYYSPCVDRKTFTPSYEEFCPSLTEVGCSVTRRTGASCGTSAQQIDSSLLSPFDYWGNGTIVGDMFADNCPYFVPNSNKDCEDPTHQSSALLREEVYGGGSKCFSGTLFSSSQSLPKRTNYCFKSSCEKQKDGTYFLALTIGSTTVTCKSSGSVTVSGFKGQIDCPDPSVYCTTYGAPFCPRGCMGRGQCVKNACVCNDGWGGESCSIKLYAHGCQRCKNNPTDTSCFGDICVCNPSNPNCNFKPITIQTNLALQIASDAVVSSSNTGSSQTSSGSSSTSSSTSGSSSSNTNSGSTSSSSSGIKASGTSGTVSSSGTNSQGNDQVNNASTDEEERSVVNEGSIFVLPSILCSIIIALFLY